MPSIILHPSLIIYKLTIPKHISRNCKNVYENIYGSVIKYIASFPDVIKP